MSSTSVELDVESIGDCSERHDVAFDQVGSTQPDELDPALREMNYLALFLLFLRFGVLAWGGPMAQIDMLKTHFVDQLNWVSKARFNHVLAVYQALPGPEATELACYFGMLSRGRPGAIIAGLGFLLPGFSFMLLISILYVNFGLSSPIVSKSLASVQPCVAAMVLRAVHRISETALYDDEINSFSIHLLLLAIFAALQNVAGINFAITLVYGGLLYGFFKHGQGRHRIQLQKTTGPEIIPRIDDPSHGESREDLTGQIEPVEPQRPSSVSWRCSRTSPLPWYAAALFVLVAGVTTVLALRLTVGLGWLGVGNGPSGGLIASNSLWGLFALGLLAGLLTFGGAYTAIPFVQQDAVVAGKWISPQAFLDGIALTQIIPAPLVMFSTFVGFLGGGLPGSLLMTVGMFLPAFSFTLIGHHFFERIVKIDAVRAFLEGVTGSVVGLIAVTVIQLIKETVTSPHTSILFGLSLSVLYGFKSPWTSPLLVISVAIAGQVLL
jgi:chromate transporter